MTITCKHCNEPKDAQLFRPSDIRNRTNLCRECRKSREPTATGAGNRYWRTSMARFFGTALASGRAR